MHGRACRATRWLGPAVGTLAAAVLAAPSAAEPAPPVEAVAARICGDIFASVGSGDFLRRFGGPEQCVAEVASSAADAVAACAEVLDRDACIHARARSVVAEHTGEEHASGGVYTTGSGANVRVVSAEGSGVTEEERRRWAEFLAGLPHGDELAKVTLRLGAPEDVRGACGASALACYLPETQTIVAAAHDREDAPNARALVAHEYGHHVANNRLNPPWAALDRGPKRWATYMRICERLRSREFAARALWSPGYRLLPAEGFAEAYRVLAELRLGWRPAPWMLVDERFYPHAEALLTIEQDVRDPWVAPTRTTLRGRRTRSFTVATPLDGEMRVAVRSAPGTVYRVSAPSRVCGQRNIVVRVQRVRGDGPFQLTVFRP